MKYRDVKLYLGMVGAVLLAVSGPILVNVFAPETVAEETPQLETCAPQGDYSYPVHVTDCYDGDTCTVTVNLGMGVFLHEQKIRLYGINTPELRGEEREEGLKVRDWLRERVVGKDIIMVTPEDKKGKYGRWLGTFYANGVNVNEELVIMGMAKEVTY